MFLHAHKIKHTVFLHKCNRTLQMLDNHHVLHKKKHFLFISYKVNVLFSLLLIQGKAKWHGLWDETWPSSRSCSSHIAVIRRCRGRKGKRLSGKQGCDPLHGPKPAVMRQTPSCADNHRWKHNTQPHPFSYRRLQRAGQEVWSWLLLLEKITKITAQG